MTYKAFGRVYLQPIKPLCCSLELVPLEQRTPLLKLQPPGLSYFGIISGVQDKHPGSWHFGLPFRLQSA